MNRLDQYLGEVSGDAAEKDAANFRGCSDILKFKREVLKRTVRLNERNKYLWAVTLTFPDKTRREHLYPLLYLFADLFADRDGEGAWFCTQTRDGSKKPPFGIHASGLALTSLSPTRLVDAWGFRSAAPAKAMCVHLVGGQEVRSEQIRLYRCPNPHKVKQGGRLVDLADLCAGKSLRQNLADIVAYAIRPDRRLDVMPLRSRMVGAGSLGKAWSRATGWPLAGRGFDPLRGIASSHNAPPGHDGLGNALSPDGQSAVQAPTSAEPVLERRACPRCGVLHKPGSRKKFCDKCRTKEWHAARRAGRNSVRTRSEGDEDPSDEWRGGEDSPTEHPTSNDSD